MSHQTCVIFKILMQIHSIIFQGEIRKISVILVTKFMAYPELGCCCRNFDSCQSLYLENVVSCHFQILITTLAIICCKNS